MSKLSSLTFVKRKFMLYFDNIHYQFAFVTELYVLIVHITTCYFTQVVYLIFSFYYLKENVI